jgi:hypothetical protein
MNNKTLYLFLFFAVFFVTPSFGAFPVKHTSVINSTTTTRKNATVTHNITHNPSSLKTKFARLLSTYSEQYNPVRRRNDTEGLLSLIFGIAGVVSPVFGILFSIPAIILGAAGKKRDEKFSKTGFVLGIVGVGIYVLYIVFLIVVIIAINSFLAGFSYGII